MKVKVHGPAAGYGPSGTIDSWSPDQLVEVDDDDKVAVAWARKVVGSDLAELVEDVATKSTAAAKKGS
jgi:hypothetical protein